MDRKIYTCRSFVFVLFFILSIAPEAGAQLVRGRIVQAGKPVVGAQVRKKGDSFRVLTDTTGRFLVEAQPGRQLVVEYGEAVFRLTASENMLIDLSTLVSLSSPGVADRRRDTFPGRPLSLGAITELTSDDFNQGNLYDPLALINGRVPGLLLSRPGGDPLATFDVRLRGLHTLSPNYPSWYGLPVPNSDIDLTRPLLVVDGMPGASLLGVDPLSIQSIQVLRDAASAAAYGTRGGNGVIIVETRSGAAGPPRLTYQTYAAMDRPAAVSEVLSADAFRQAVTTPGTVYYNPQMDLGSNTDWIEAITRTGWSQAHQLAVEGGTANTSYRGAFHFRDVQGVALRSGFDQWNGQGRVQHRLWKDRLVVGANLAHTRRSFQDVDPLVFRQAAIYNPTAPVRADGFDTLGGYYQREIFFYYNPVAILEQNRREGRQQVSSAQADARLTVLDGLTLHARYAWQREEQRLGILDPRDAYYRGRAQGGYAERRIRRHDNQWLDLSTAYERRFGDHNLRARLGYAFQRWDYWGEGQTGSGFPSGDFSYDDLSPAQFQASDSTRSRDEWVVFSGRLGYQFRQTWFLDAGLSLESASRFGPADKWAWFPSLRTGVALDRLLGRSNVLHLRLGYGVTGQLPPKNYGAFLQFGPAGPFYYNGGYQQAYVSLNTPNPAIRGERRQEWNAGIDLGLGRNRAFLRMDYFRTQTKDLALVALLSGAPQMLQTFYANYGALRTHGVEIALEVKALERNSLTWTTGLQLAAGKTKIASLNGPEGYSLEGQRLGNFGSPGLCCELPFKIEKGKPVGQYYGPTSQGISPEGTWQFLDRNGDRWIDTQDETAIGNAQPDLSFGWHNDLNLGRFDCSFLWRGVLGHSMVNTHRLFYGDPVTLQRTNAAAEALTGDLARLRDYNRFSDFFVEDASFLRLEFLALGYRIDLGLEKTRSRLRLQLTTQNLFTVSAYSGPDPEVRLMDRGAPLSAGIDGPNNTLAPRAFYYPVRTLLLGLRLDW